MITDLGSLTIAAIVPAAADATAAIDISTGIAAPDASAQLTALAGFAPSASLSLADQLTIAQGIVANIQAAISLGLTPPSLSLQASLAASIKADLQAKLGTIEVQVSFSLALQELLATSSVRLLVYSGPQDDFGSELATELGAPTTACNALVLLTTNGASWTAMQGVFRTS